MATKIFVNLPVKDLNKSIDFFTKLGYKFDPQFTDEKAACMIVSEDIYVMLVVESFFKTFTKKEICDASAYTETIISLSADKRENVDEMIKKAVQAGGTTPHKPTDYGWMYQHGFQDLDGHLWELIYMDMSKIDQALQT
jgi:predicted lactoylglutathione lyase